MLLSYTPAKSYNSVVISCPKLTSGETYTLLAGDTTTTDYIGSLVKSVKKISVRLPHTFAPLRRHSIIFDSAGRASLQADLL